MWAMSTHLPGKKMTHTWLIYVNLSDTLLGGFAHLMTIPYGDIRPVGPFGLWWTTSNFQDKGMVLYNIDI